VQEHGLFYRDGPSSTTVVFVEAGETCRTQSVTGRQWVGPNGRALSSSSPNSVITASDRTRSTEPRIAAIAVGRSIVWSQARWLGVCAAVGRRCRSGDVVLVQVGDTWRATICARDDS